MSTEEEGAESLPYRRHKYDQLQQDRPELFFNTGAGGIDVLLAHEDIDRVEQAARTRLAAGRLPQQWATVGVVYEDEYLLILRDAVRFPNGREGTYVRVLPSEEAPGVAVLPLLNGDFVLVKHYRHATRQWHLEIPRGFGSTGARPDVDARRELTEEIGARIVEMHTLCGMHIDTGLTSSRAQLYFAVLAGVGDADLAEGISDIALVPCRDLLRMVASGEITDSFTLAAITAAHSRGLVDLPAVGN